MRIARILTRLNLGGPARQVLASDPLLAERGHVVRVFAGVPERGEGDLFDALVAAGVDVVRIPGLRRGVSPARDLFARRKLKAHLRAFEPDVVHTHASKAGTLGRQAARSLPARVARVHTFHGHVLEGYFSAFLSRQLARHEAALARETDRVIAVSHATADDLVRLGVAGEEQLVVVPPGIALEPFLAIAPLGEGTARRSGRLRGPVGAAPDVVLVGVVGRLAEVKRPGRALDVFALLHERYPQMHLAFVGDGDERGRLERRIAALGRLGEERVHVFGAVEDMPAVMADLDAVLLTSRSEGMPVALIEAAAAALPVVATPVGGVPELVAHERTGFLGADADELAFGLAQLLDDARERAAMGQRARMRVHGRHAAVTLADKLEEVYRVVRDERASRTRS